MEELKRDAEEKWQAGTFPGWRVRRSGVVFVVMVTGPSPCRRTQAVQWLNTLGLIWISLLSSLPR